MNDDTYNKFKALQRKHDCVSDPDLPPILASVAMKEGVRLGSQEEMRTADWHLCSKATPDTQRLPEAVIGQCSRCKCDVIFCPPPRAALICIDCALSLEEEEVTE